MQEHVTVMPPDGSASNGRGVLSEFPTDLLSRAAGRLRVVALLYAFVFFMGGIFPALLFPNDRARFLGSFAQWGPGVIRGLAGSPLRNHPAREGHLPAAPGLPFTVGGTVMRAGSPRHQAS